MFASAGYEDTSVKSIAKAANVGHGTVFLHFLGKAHLYAEVLQLAGDRFLSRARRRSATTYGTLAETLDGWICELARCDEASTLLGVVNRTDPRPAISAAAGSVHVSFVDFWHLRLESWFGASAAGPERLRELARLIVVTAWGFAAVRLDGSPRLKSPTIVEDFVRAIETMAARLQSD